jgi:hypothetical protein
MTLFRLPIIWRYLLIIWLIATLFNINKAYHIDDTFHLEAAESIKANPTHPLSGLINWDDSPKPMYKHNQPPLLFYIISLHSLIFGNSELAMHLLLSIFSFLSLFYFLKLVELFDINEKKRLLMLLGFSPAFIVNQNLMTDIPVLSILLAMNYYLIRVQIYNWFKDYLIASFFISIGLLIKYSILPFLIVICLTAILSKQLKNILAITLPVIVLSLWSLWNKYEFGNIHMFSRPKIIFNYELIFAFLGTLGSISVFSLLYARPILLKNRIFTIVSFLSLIIIMGVIQYIFFNDMLLEHIMSSIFITNGILIFAVILIKVIQLFMKNKLAFLSSPSIVLLLGIAGISLFIIIFAPFNATRHVLIIIPLILLFFDYHIPIKKGRITTFIISANIILGILLAISDWNYANFYRKQAKEIKVTNEKYWSFGHWGWQWYSKKAGMTIYSTSDRTKLKKGDFIILPKYVAKQQLPKGIELEIVKLYIHQPSIFTFFSVHNGRFYNSSLKKPSWTFSSKSYDTIFQFRVKCIVN